MNKTAIFYGSSTGNTESVAKTIATKLNADIYNVADDPIENITDYNNLIFGSSTWGFGDLQDDWEGFLPKLAKADLNGKTIALFGLGDCEGYPDTFVDAIGAIYETIKDKGCKIIGMVKTSEYSISDSKAIIDGSFVGLPLDEDNESSLTNSRLDNWLNDISKQF